MARDAIPATVLLDALGTLVELERPWPLLAGELRARGVVVSEDDARRAMMAEMAYYRAHHDEASTFAGLRDLRRRCAGVVQDVLATALPIDEVQDALLSALRFRAFPEVAEVLGRLRAGGARLAVVSNWDVSLHDVLERTSLRTFVDEVVTSAEVGAAKPDPAIFRAALARLGRSAAGAVHVGDSLDFDVAGAHAAGLEAVLVARDGDVAAKGVRTISSLRGLLGPS
jgi:putative hydrolase of the HAD superfamily